MVGAVAAGEVVSVLAEGKDTGSCSSLRKYKAADTFVAAEFVRGSILPLEALCLHTEDSRHSQVVGHRSPWHGLGRRRKRPPGAQNTTVGHR